MFLFTTPPATSTVPANPVLDAIRAGAQASGTDFDYLLRTAQRESSLNPAARASTSSATGLFQFIEQTWLAMVKREGPRFGLEREAQAIAQRPDGGLSVADPALRREILALREDPETSAVMAGALTNHNRDSLAGALGREPRPADLYVAHVLGARGATSLIDRATHDPTVSAADMFPEAARANKAIFYDRSGRARGAGEVYAVLAAHHAASASASATAPSDEAETPVAPYAKLDGPAFHGLFQTGGRTGAVSDAVARLWSARSDETSGVAPGFFPRSRPAIDRTAANPPAIEAQPRESAAIDDPAPAPAPALAPAPPPDRARRPRPAPLDLRQFMTIRRAS
ncbi:MAG: lytic transglycosylase domain-containing protein [Salinarimonadaceae bacterium]|nr:MAG: lytic transglycosylase domain-containing protein [Salinarimonadaceae bacterium]